MEPPNYCPENLAFHRLLVGMGPSRSCRGSWGNLLAPALSLDPNFSGQTGTDLDSPGKELQLHSLTEHRHHSY